MKRNLNKLRRALKKRVSNLTTNTRLQLLRIFSKYSVAIQLVFIFQAMASKIARPFTKEIKKRGPKTRERVMY